MSYETIRYEVADGIATVTLNRPDVYNAMNSQMMNELIAVFDETDRDDAVRVVIVTGEGKAFCGGADLTKGADIFDKDKSGAVRTGESIYRPDGTIDYGKEAARDGGGKLALRIFASLKPVIGAINGAGVGVGASMLLPMDIRVASEKARMGFVYARRGIVFECCSSWFLPRVVGIAQGPGVELQRPGDERRRTERGRSRQLRGAARPVAGQGAGNRARNRRQHGARVDRADAADGVAQPRHGPPDGGASLGKPRHHHARQVAGREGRRALLQGEAPAEFPLHRREGHAGLFPVVGRAEVQLTDRARAGIVAEEERTRP